MTESRRILCISDLHLSADRPDLFYAFSAFLTDTVLGDPQGKADALYILGDFFNLWIGDDDPDAFAGTVSEQLLALTNAGTDVFIMHGNRDFLLGQVFADRCGASLINDPFRLSVENQNYLLSHGDALCTRDTDYMAFRQMVRDPAWQQGFLAKPLAERQAFADEARARSKAMSSNKADDIMDVTPDEVIGLLTETGQTLLVHGHTHRPAIHDIDVAGKPGKRIVLGDWDKKGWYLELTPSGYQLIDFDI